MTQVQDAFRRAFGRSGNPLGQRYDAFSFKEFSLRDRLTRQIDDRLHYRFSAPGARKAADADEWVKDFREEPPRGSHGAGRLIAEERGKVIITLFHEYDASRPIDYLRDHNGIWFRVKTYLGADAIQAGVRMEAYRRYGVPPIVAGDAP